MPKKWNQGIDPTERDRTMEYNLHQVNGQKIVEITDTALCIQNAGDFLGLVAELPGHRVIFYKNHLVPAFFDLSTCIAGEIVQKAINYRLQVAVIGDYSGHQSNSLRDFIRESNRTNQVIFVQTLEEALERFGK